MTLAALAMSCGCGAGGGKPTVDLEGTVTIGGQPVPPETDGSISFMPQKSGLARPTAAQIIDGKYVAKNVPIGPVSVVLSLQKKTGKIITLPGGSTFPEYKSILPDDAGGERLEVTADMETHDFDL